MFSIRRYALVAAATACLGFALSAAAIDGNWITLPAAADSPNISGVDDGNSVRPAAVVEAGNGRIYGVWSEPAGTTSDVFLAVYDPDTRAWQELGNVSDTPDVHSRAPRLTVDSAGDIWIAWQEGETIDTDKMLEDIQNLSTDLKTISQGGGSNARKLLDIGAAMGTFLGNFTVSTPPSHIYVRRFTPAARSFNAAAEISGNDNQSFASRPDIGLRNGRPFVVWEYIRLAYTEGVGAYSDLIGDSLNNFGEIYGKGWDGDSWESLDGSAAGYDRTQGQTGISGSGLDSPALAPRIVHRSSDGEPVVVWQEMLFKFSFTTQQDVIDLADMLNQTPSYFGLAQAHLRYHNNGNWSELDGSASDLDGGLSRLPGIVVGNIDIARGPGDDLSVVYQATNPADQTIRIAGKQFRDTGRAFSWTDNSGLWNDISASPFGYAIHPAVVYNGTQEPVVAWVDGLVTVFAKLWNGSAWENLGNSTYSGGTALQDILSEISFYTDGENVAYGFHANPDLARLPNGNPLIVWQRAALPSQTQSDLLALTSAEGFDMSDPQDAQAALAILLDGAAQAEYDIWVKAFNRAPQITAITPDAQQTLIDPGQAVNFTCQATDVDVDPLSYHWDFGDGSGSELEDPGDHVYGAAGNYTVTLTVTDPYGATDTKNRTITASFRPVATIDSPADNAPNQAPDITIPDGEAVNFQGSWTDADDPDPGSMSFLWTFGPGALPADGQDRLEDPGDVTYQLPNQVLDRTYTVTFTVTDEFDVSSELTLAGSTRFVRVIKDAQRPVAVIDTPSGQTIAIGDTLNFTGTATDADGTVVRHAWVFSDSPEATSMVGSTSEDPGDVTFLQAGVYEVAYTVTDDDGLVSVPAVVTITVEAPNDAPVITVDPAGPVIVDVNGAAPDTAAGVTAADTEDGDLTGAIVIGGDAVDPNTPGSYTVSYHVEDSGGKTADAARTYTVDDPPNGKISATGPDATVVENEDGPTPRLTIGSGESVDFAGSATDASPGPGGVDDLLFSWDFAGGTGGNADQAAGGSVSFAQVGIHTVTLTVTDGYGVADPSPPDIEIEVVGIRPVAVIDAPAADLNIAIGETVDFTGHGTDADGAIDSYEWVFNPNAVENPDAVVPPGSLQPTANGVRFDAGGVYEVRFFVTDNSGLTSFPDTVTVTVVGNRPVITVDPADVTLAVGAAIDPAFAAGATATDVEDDDTALTNGIVIGGDTGMNTTIPGVYTITYDVTDSDGLAADQKTRTYRVSSKPVITVEPADVFLAIGDAAPSGAEQLQGVTATDAEDGDLTDSIIATGNIDTGVAGDYVVNYDVTDSHGSAADTQSRTYHVIGDTDDDADGLPDDWEAFYFGDTGTTNGDGDNDGDGIKNADEYANGTNPTTPTIIFRQFWNLIAWPRDAAPNDRQVHAVLETQLAGVPWVGPVWGQDSVTGEYYPLENQTAAGRENYMSPANAYWVYCTASAVKDVFGNVVDGVPSKHLGKGWRLAAPLASMGVDIDGRPLDLAGWGVDIVWGWIGRYEIPTTLYNTRGYWYGVKNPLGADIDLINQ